MMRDHTRIEELLAIRAIGGLDAHDEAELEREMATHGPDCQECRRFEIEYEETAGRLALALDPVAVRDGFAQETFERAFGGAAEPSGERLGAPRRRGWLRPLVGVAAAVVLFAGGVIVGTAVTGEQPSEKTVLTFQSETEPGTLAAAFTPGSSGVYMVGTGLPTLPQGKVYELWLFTGDTPASAMCATPTSEGSVFGFSDSSLEGVGLMAVTVESSDCPTAPTTQPVFTAEVGA